MKKALLIILFTLFRYDAMAQGCSDAGFCSIGALKNVDLGNAPRRSFDIGMAVGDGESRTLTLTPYLQYSHTLNKHLSIQTKLTAVYASGFLGKAFNAGDIFGSVIYKLHPGTTAGLRLLAGIKVPLTTANSKDKDGRSLPLDYQSGIGTYDIIGGLNYIFLKHIEVDAGLQLPVVQQNHNSFFNDGYTDQRVRNFASTNQFRRKADALLRLGYYIDLPANITFKPNFLALYHLGLDSYVYYSGKRIAINGTRGLTVNGGITLSKKFSNNNRLELLAATPFIARRVRADGLTREAVYNLQYSISF